MANYRKNYGVNHRWVEIKKSGSLLIRFTYQGIDYKFAPVHRGRSDNPQDLAIANRVASEIELAVKLGKFEGLTPWQPKTLVEKIETHKPLTLTEIWQQYKIAKADKVSKASQLSVWLQVDRCLEYLGKKRLPQSVSAILPVMIVKLLLQEYSTPVVARALSDLHAACNLAVKRKLISSNPLTGYKDELPDTPKSARSKECYSLDEVNLIIQTFKDSKFNHYARFIEFLFLTGVRPQLAIALTWGDVKNDTITFNKGFTKGVVTQGKTTRETVYPMFPQLRNLLKAIQYGYVGLPYSYEMPSDELVFPSPTGKYIDLHNFTQRVWKPLITDLVTQGKLTKYLPTYHCRHSTATLLAKAGIPSSTIAALLDTSETMLNKHYFDNQELTNVVIPDLL